MFVDMLLAMVWTGQKMSAKSACCLAWWAGRAGALGVAKIGYRPTSPSGHFQRHLDKVVGVTPKVEGQFLLKVPMNCRHDA
eukprot:1297114-Alexandrium_andersonii.AAC.1